MEGLGYTPETVLDCPSTFQLEGARQVWEDWTVAYGVGAQGPLTLHQALVNSCNTIFYGIGRELDAISEEVLADLGADDAAYIRRVIAAQRGLEAGGRLALLVSLFPPAWLAGSS